MVLRAQRNYIPPRVLGHKGFKELWLPASKQTNGFLFLADKGAGIHKLAHTGIQICLHTAHTHKEKAGFTK